MGLFKSLRGKVDVGTTGQGRQDKESEGDQHQYRPAYTTEAQTQSQTQPQGHFRRQSQTQTQAPKQNQNNTQKSSDEQYEPPPGPPPSHSHFSGSATQEYTHQTFLPPPGPPPTAKVGGKDRPPATQTEMSTNTNTNINANATSNPPPYHDWTVIPDTALLPPPPPLPEDYSPTNNASYDSAARAHEWCARHPVYTPSLPSREIQALVAKGEITLEGPPRAVLSRGFVLRPIPTSRETPTSRQTPTSTSRQTPSSTSTSTSTSSSSSSSWLIRTPPSQQDAIITSTTPLYFAAADSPLFTHHSKTIFFEIVVRRISNANSGVAIGFAAKPYPPWRLPGWHRGSIGVHGDDGRRYVNDSWGGREFVDAFHEGETVGVGMTFETVPTPTPTSGGGGGGGCGGLPAYGGTGGGYGNGDGNGNSNSNSNSHGFGSGFGIGKVKTTAFITRQGRTDDRWKWDIDEERDVRDEGVDGLMGEGDLYAAIGVFGGVEVEVRFGAGMGWDERH